MPRRPRSSASGSSLIEVMIAMAVLTVGLLAMWHLHMIGITSTAAGRRHTLATAIARELASGLERLPYADPRLSENATGIAVPSGSVFGNLVTGTGAVVAGAHEWSDGTPVPGVRLGSEMREQAEGGGYERRWSVFGLVSPRAPVGSPAGVKLIAVSVVWRDPPFARPREVVLYTQLQDPAAVVGMGTNP